LRFSPWRAFDDRGTDWCPLEPVNRPVREIRLALQHGTSMCRKFGLVLKFGFCESRTFRFVDSAPMLPKIVIHICGVIKRQPATSLTPRQGDVLV
jgi:hypothetical protein